MPAGLDGLLWNAGGEIYFGAPFPELRILERGHAVATRHRDSRRQLEHAPCRELRLLDPAETPERDQHQPMTAGKVRALLYGALRRRQSFVVPAGNQVRQTRADDECAHPRIERTDAHGTLEMFERRIALARVRRKRELEAYLVRHAEIFAKAVSEGEFELDRLSFPLGHVGVIAGIALRLELYLKFNFVPSILSEGLYLWTALTMLGYLQWFVLLPLVAQKCRQLSDFLFKRDPAR